MNNHDPQRSSESPEDRTLLLLEACRVTFGEMVHDLEVEGARLSQFQIDRLVELDEHLAALERELPRRLSA